jgi:hypothetical protein
MIDIVLADEFKLSIFVALVEWKASLGQCDSERTLRRLKLSFVPLAG